MILVGVDGSQTALEAVSWAVQEAALRGAGLRIVHIMPAWPLEMAEDAPYADVGRWMRDGAASMLTDAVERAREQDGHVEVESLLLPGDPRLVLIEAAKDADLLVVGSRGRGGLAGLLLGSVSHALLHHAACPLIVTPAPARPWHT
ncbi:universal stress protein [Streptosporangium sp. NBC_01756]|uniref:universal stress protein n=1 Tax=Streptosporangium sp. NBC_01756 TaxID=2975950 RepID=UPI002DDABAB8|nr:universal stress protein [Streptosporangium sp. NBC_01756]WSC86420.1 universal stress protein [Streptosporangium sp. NBC_01756]